MTRFLPAIVILALAVALVSCSSSSVSAPGASATPSVAGTWEFLAVSSNGGGTTGIEVALQEGTVLINGVSEPNGDVSATGVNQIAFVCLNSAGGVISFGGNCAGQSGVCTTTGVNSLSGTADSIGGPFTFTYSENGNAFSVTGTLGSDGQSFVNGTYEQQTGGACVDSGSVTGLLVPKLTGVYTGKMTLPDGTVDSVTATLSQSSGILTVQIIGSTPENVSFNLTGPVTGHAFAVQGQFGGDPAVAYEGYFEVAHQSLYFVNTANPAYTGTLTLQQ